MNIYRSWDVKKALDLINIIILVGKEKKIYLINSKYIRIITILIHIIN